MVNQGIITHEVASFKKSPTPERDLRKKTQKFSEVEVSESISRNKSRLCLEIQTKQQHIVEVTNLKP
ncbi:hypothetical protein YC2023_021756 [Brassica napus]